MKQSVSVFAQSFKKSSILVWMMVFFYSLGANAQLTGTKNVPGDYATLALAINDLNSVGTGVGGVTINLLAGNPQTAPAGGYVITTLAGSASNPIIINGNNNNITAPTPQGSGLRNDALIKLVGADWVTIQGFTLLENAANTTTAIASNNMTEWGIALLYGSTTNGAQNISIINNTIDLNRTYVNSVGIYSNSAHSASAPNISASATTVSGSNSNLTIHSNLITDVSLGISIVGATVSVNNFNTGIDIGGTSSITGNSIKAFGAAGGMTAGFVGLYGTIVTGIFVTNSFGYNISHNTVSSFTGASASTALYGIFIPEFSIVPPASPTYSNSINYNKVSLKSGSSSLAINSIYVSYGTATTATTTNVRQNNFFDTYHTVASTGNIFLLSYVGSNPGLVDGNTFTNLSFNTSGLIILLNIGSSSACRVINNTTVGNIARTTAGKFYGIYRLNVFVANNNEINKVDKKKSYNNNNNLNDNQIMYLIK